MEEKYNQGGNLANGERTYTQSEVNAIINQYNIKLEQLKKSAEEEINKRDLSNFYQTLSVLFEIVRNRDAYTPSFLKKVVETIESGVTNIFNEDKERVKDE